MMSNARKCGECDHPWFEHDSRNGCGVDGFLTGKCECTAEPPVSKAVRRTPQLSDAVVLELRLPMETEEWAEDLLADYDTVRSDDALIVREEVGGNCNAVANAASFLRDVEDALSGGGVDPMALTLTVTAK
jgi:hypothetical protein